MIALDALDRVRERKRRHDAVDALCRAAQHPPSTSSPTSGRAASWTSTTTALFGTSASASRTDSARVSPPVTTAETFDAASSSASRIAGSSQPGGAATTIASTQSEQVEPLEALGEQRASGQRGERLRAIGSRAVHRRRPRPARPRFPPPSASGLDRRASAASTVAAGGARRPVSAFARGAQTLAAATCGLVRDRFGATGLARTSSSHACASSSLMSFAYMSSEARIFFAFTYICFSPVERPFS